METDRGKEFDSYISLTSCTPPKKQAWTTELLASTLRSKKERIKSKREKIQVEYPIVHETEKHQLRYPTNAQVRRHMQADLSLVVPENKSNSTLDQKKFFLSLTRRKRIRKATTKVTSLAIYNLEKDQKEKTSEKRKAEELSGRKLIRDPSAKDKGTSSSFRRFKLMYDRGDLPACVRHGARRKLQWKCRLQDIDVNYYLPLFSEGLCVPEEPYCFLSFHGVLDLINFSKQIPLSNNHNISKRRQSFCLTLSRTLPRIMLPLKHALNTKNKVIICRVLVVLQKLCHIDNHIRINIPVAGTFIGAQLVKYYKYLLPMINLILVLHRRRNLGDRMDFRQINYSRKMLGHVKDNILDLVVETLEMLEETGGCQAKSYIMNFVPTYHSFRENRKTL